MENKIKAAIALEGYRLHVLFTNDELRELDMKPYIEKMESFKEFKKSPETFENVNVSIGGYGVYWNENLFLNIKDIIENGKLIDCKTDFYSVSKEIIGYIVDYRKKHDISQQDLANMSGVAQPAIARIESGKTDPQLSTFMKIINSLGLKVNFENNDSVEFAIAVNSVDGVPPSRKERIILSLLSQSIIDYESALFIMKRMYQ